MERLTFVFGDWSDDGHGRTAVVVATALSKSHVRKAIDEAMDRFGYDIFDEMANECEDASITEVVAKALDETGFSLAKAIEMNDEYDIKLEDVEDMTFAEFIEEHERYYWHLEVIEAMYFWILNACGAGIAKEKPYPVIDTGVGYGCFLA